MSNLFILRTYAQTVPDSLPASVLFNQSARNLVIFDAYPKSMFHFLVLPRLTKDDAATVQPGDSKTKSQGELLDAQRLFNLHSLLGGDRKVAQEVIKGMAEDAKAVKQEIEEEMVDRYGFKWDVWMGFHGAPSMAHLHLHILSADLISEKLKNKKHYNSFHPKLGFFLHLDDVLSWFDTTPTFFASKVKGLKPSNYQPILKEPLACFHCEREMKNIPTLKAHLQEEWEKLQNRAKKATAHHPKLKRKTPEVSNDGATSSKDTEERADQGSKEPETKRAKLDGAQDEEGVDGPLRDM